MGIIIPEHQSFSALALDRHPDTGDLRFLPGPVVEVCRVNDLDPGTTVNIRGDRVRATLGIPGTSLCPDARSCVLAIPEGSDSANVPLMWTGRRL